GRVALSPRGVERRDAHRPAERDRTAHHSTADSRFATVGRVAQRKPGQLNAAAHHPALGLKAGSGDPVVETRDLPIEARQLPLADDVDEAGPRLAIEGLRLLGVVLPDPVRVR